MAVTNTIPESFAHEDAKAIVTAIHGRLGTTEGLKDTVVSEMKQLLNVEKLPDRVQTWVHRYCLAIISPKLPQKKMSEKVATPLDLKSLFRENR